jgi:hypothetical protein
VRRYTQAAEPLLVDEFEGKMFIKAGSPSVGLLNPVSAFGRVGSEDPHMIGREDTGTLSTKHMRAFRPYPYRGLGLKSVSGTGGRAYAWCLLIHAEASLSVLGLVARLWHRSPFDESEYSTDRPADGPTALRSLSKSTLHFLVIDRAAQTTLISTLIASPSFSL